MSVLSKDCDAMGYFYGFYGDDYRQINVRHEPDGWVAYVHGERIGAFVTKDGAEDAAIAWVRANPQDADD